jgi:hypothetical protein
MLNLQQGELLVRNRKRTGVPYLDEIIGWALFIDEVDGEEIKTTIAYPSNVTGKIILANRPDTLEGIFDSRPMCFVDRPAGFAMDAEDWFLLCLLFGRSSPPVVEEATKIISAGIGEMRKTLVRTMILDAINPERGESSSEE